MKRFAIALVSSVVLISGLTSCQTKQAAIVTDGSGTEELTPLRATRVIVANTDPDFADQIAAHNEWCKTKPGCKKATSK